VLDEKLVKEAFKYSQVKTKKELISIALKEFVENRRRMNLLDLEGNIEFAEGYDYKKSREST
jgi:Arc/MetJ family transcription regulator